ncbi:Tetratricopeptide repeat protein [Aliarcobacter thereius]|uniref:tetratricopeptide repeat protein n=1 Tax=Aliarcobacter thereius TaxID=544718 RepID=UPI000827D334|nr:tetratricopeptide repeat protein [Aliarcobacter thereius]OCL85561.1 Tetratricopeptide repeat protein [Aliarcobacter thereius]
MNNKIKQIFAILVILCLIAFIILAFLPEEKKVEEIVKREPSIKPLYWDGKEIYSFAYENDLETTAKRAFKEAMDLFYKDNYEEAMIRIEYSNYIMPLAENSDLACQILDDLNKFEEAISWCTQAYELGNENSLIGIGLAYRGVKNYEEALKWFHLANEKQIPNSANGLGLAYSAIGDYANAEKWYLQAIKDDPKNSNALNNLIYFYIVHLNDKIRGAAYAIASVNNVFPANTIAKFLIVTHKIPLEDLQKAYEFQLNNPILPYNYDEDREGIRIGFLTEEDYKETIEDYTKPRRFY